MTRVQLAAALAGVLVLLLVVWWVRRPGPLRVPDRIGSLQRQSDGVYSDADEALRNLAEEERRIGDAVVGVYGDPAAQLPTAAVVAGVIKIGHGDQIVSALTNGLAVSGVRVSPTQPAPGGRHGGTFACGDIAAGGLEGTYCTWHDELTVGAVVVYGRGPAEATVLAAQVRDAVQR